MRPGHRPSADPQFLAFLALRLTRSWPCNPRFCGPRPPVPQYRDCPTPPVFSPDLLPGSSRVPYLRFPSFLAPGSPVLRPLTFLFLGPPNSRIPVCGRPDPPAPASGPLSLAARQLSGCADLSSLVRSTLGRRLVLHCPFGRERASALHFERRFCPEVLVSQASCPQLVYSFPSWPLK